MAWQNRLVVGTRRRHHFIPRFLLNRFASRSEGKKHWVLQIGGDGTVREVSTRDAAVSSRFYGEEQAGVEDGLVPHETEFAETLRLVDQGENPNRLADSLRRVVWLTAVRTRAMRGQLARTGEQVIPMIPALLGTEGMKLSILREVRDRLEELLRIEAEKASPVERAEILALLSDSRQLEQAKQASSEIVRRGYLGDLASAMVEQLSGENILATSSRGGQIGGLTKLLEKDQAPEWFDPADWQVIEGSPGSVILGDACVAARSASGQNRSILMLKEDWESVYFPISSSTVVVAKRDPTVTSMKPRLVNEASARLSESYIYAADLLAVPPSLPSLIGTGSPFLDSDDLEALLEDWS